MRYTRPDVQDVKNKMADLTKRLEAAKDYAAAQAIFLEKEELIKHMETQATLAHIRHDIDTRDTFYDEEVKFFSAAIPELEEYSHTKTLGSNFEYFLNNACSLFFVCVSSPTI